MTDSTRCPECGAAITDQEHDRFCNACGSSLADATRFGLGWEQGAALAILVAILAILVWHVAGFGTAGLQQVRVEGIDADLIEKAAGAASSARDSAEERSCFANQRTLEGAAQTFLADTGALPADLADMVPDYVKQFPVCPATIEGYEMSGDTVMPCSVHGHY